MRLAAFAIAFVVATGVAAQTYPTKSVRVIVPFPPGPAADIFSRAGGGGIPGMMAGKQAAPDGYTLIVGTSGTLGVNVNIYGGIPYDPLKDFAPASNIFIAPLVLVAHPHFASAGPGTEHMTGELFKSRAGIDLVHVPYKGSGPGMTDLIGGQVKLD